MMRTSFFVLCMLLSVIAKSELDSDVVKIGYGIPFVTADVDEDEINPNQYEGYNLDAHRGWIAQYIVTGGGSLAAPLSFKMMSIDTKEDNGDVEKNKLQTFSLGFAQGNWESIGRGLDLYGLVDVGVGVSKFSFESTRYRAHADVGLEGGIAFHKRFTIGANVNFIVVGYPTETIAHVGLFSLNLGFRL